MHRTSTRRIPEGPRGGPPEGSRHGRGLLFLLLPSHPLLHLPHSSHTITTTSAAISGSRSARTVSLVETLVVEPWRTNAHHQGLGQTRAFSPRELGLVWFLLVCCLVVTEMVGRPFRSSLSMSAMSGQRAQGGAAP